MPRPRRIPKLCRHRASDQAMARFAGKVKYFGRWGTPEAKEAFLRACVEWTAYGIEPEESDALTIRSNSYIKQNGDATLDENKTQEQSRTINLLIIPSIVGIIIVVVSFGISLLTSDT